MAGAPIALTIPAVMSLGLRFDASLMAVPLAESSTIGSGAIRSGLTVSAAEGTPATGAGPIDAVAVRFEDFYATHRDELARALGLALRDSALGAEAADEAFARACQRWGQVSAYANPQGWVFRVGLNWARSWLRRVRRERERRPLLAQPHATEDRARDVDLERALATLNDSHRAVIVARFYLDWSVAETADALGIATGTVKSRLSRGLEQLRDVLETAADEEDGS
ncbi:MAG: sigma-70 family RNA polymerase sigma factor [Acidimicrobiales bacterium]|uniref:sigma-70 family RNA polymerase sigma factor n=1 Tax=Candidatus Poriferisodalis multihospitum TaxID=2983191 RepID=UPI0013847399|nr:sigma-70 family RNA polymerase sigma factor [Candidatus Poriferisodalis multihospitum]MDE0133562.1 sigma-70 family RNA polymerase sigma factor [Acidimicrobiaceae bacterium]MXV86772.1 sigma-70 family RNA polymerase sigma factor [Acidimicrobiales bacterium]MDE0320274.1 sigma-70 family RNA polymerase sigma factor [Acidimicrobiaceae bacterium]MXX43220.1 sigma-70 family RNA polymerase sigma factor [Acidimicrobiales bacterium]MXY02948.1 sigma-70 family RNA polymerase sigma factor [Acidimicrobiale